MARTPGIALVVSNSMIHRDPRVSRQVESLIDAGWVVDTIGIGEPAAPGVRHHSWLRPLGRLAGSTLGTLVIHGLLRHRHRFRLLVSDQVEAKAKERISSGAYEVIVFNDIDFVPWVDDPATFTPAALHAHIHLDLHEYFPMTMRRDSLYRRFTASYNAWIRRHIGSIRFTTRSTPVRGISELYAKEFGFSTPAVIRNCPPAVEQEPGTVDPQEIKLLYHGAYNPTRGIYEIVDAMELLDERFSMTFMLVGPASYIGELRAYAEGLGDRVRFVPAVPMKQICTAVHQYDLEVMFYPPKTTNLELALPNKFFEAIQGRLGVVIGDSPMMRELVDEYELGLVVNGWSARDLAAGINSLTAQQVARFKHAAHAIAADFSAESERQAFLSIVRSSREPGIPRD